MINLKSFPRESSFKLRTKLLVWGMSSPNVGGPLSGIRVLDVQGINIKTEACDLQCGMISFAT